MMRGWSRACVLAALLAATAAAAAGAQGLLNDELIRNQAGLAGSAAKRIGSRLRNAMGAIAEEVLAEPSADIDPDGACRREVKYHCQHLLKGGGGTGGGGARGLLVDVPRSIRRPERVRRPVDKAALAAKYDPSKRNRTQDNATATEALEHLKEKYNLTMPGKGRSAPVARCLQGVMTSQRTAVMAPELSGELSESCKKDVRGFFAARAQDIRKDFMLVTACAVEIKNFCHKVVPGDGRVLACLKQSKQALSDKCAKAVTSRQVASAQDLDLDPRLKLACTPDLEAYCSGVGWGTGAKRTCLDEARARKKQLTPACKTALYQRSLEDSEDIRFDRQLTLACSADKRKFCDQVAPGRARVIHCLETHMQDTAFSSMCKKALEKRVARKSKDIRLDYRFRLFCRNDVRDLCPAFEQMVLRPWVKSGLSSSDLIECMRDHHDSIGSSKCKEHMYALQVRTADTPEYDSPLKKNCAAEIKELCSDIPAEESHTLSSCLSRHKAEGYIISQQCSTVIMKRLVSATWDFNLNPMVKKSCTMEYSRFCKDPSGKSEDAVECLRLHQDQVGFRQVCKGALSQFTIETMRDVRLVKDVAAGCKSEMQELCSGIEPGEGRVLSCLQEKRSLISSNACRDAMLHITGLATDDWRMDFQLFRNCKEDVDKFCAGVDPGHGRVHACLRANEERISPKCRMMERRMEEMESEDIRLSPHLKICGGAVRKYCQDVPPGNAARIACLQDHLAEPDFPAECHNAMTDIIEKSLTRFYLNPRVKTSCDEDVNRWCRWSELDNTDSDSSILKCLSKKIQEVEPGCRRELVRTVRLQLWRYKPNQPLTAPCDEDALKHCHADSPALPFLQSGYIAECLLRQAGNLSSTCWALISTPDANGAQEAAKLEARYWHKEFAEEALSQVASDMHNHVTGEMKKHMDGQLKRAVGKFMRENPHGSGPMSIVIVCIVAGAIGFFMAVYYRSKIKGPLVIKDGSL